MEGSFSIATTSWCTGGYNYFSSILPMIRTLSFWVLSKDVSCTICEPMVWLDQGINPGLPSSLRPLNQTLKIVLSTFGCRRVSSETFLLGSLENTGLSSSYSIHQVNPIRNDQSQVRTAVYAKREKNIHLCVCVCVPPPPITPEQDETQIILSGVNSFELRFFLLLDQSQNQV